MDVRCLGLYSWIHFSKGTDFETVYGPFAQSSPYEISDEGSGLYRVVWEFKTLRATLWIDESKDCSPVRYWIQGKSATAGQIWDEDPRLTNDVTYEKVAGVWVPSTFRFRCRQDKVERGPDQRPKKRSHNATTYLLAFDWQSVNTPVDDKYFSHEDFQLRQGTFILEHRAGEPVILEEVGRERPEFDLEDLVLCQPLILG
ncbi:MAG: hypothetical protein HQ582_21915 [Planctomycetes bacterium]|nr:hypothetical protein [Planctomycetota bacterium]